MAPPFWQMALRGTTCPTTSRWTAGRSAASRPPSHVMIEVGVALAGLGGFDADRRTRRSPASWSTSSRPRPTPRSGTSGAWRATSTPKTRRSPRSIREGQGKIFSEDLEMLERQQANLLAVARAQPAQAQHRCRRRAGAQGDRAIGRGRASGDTAGGLIHACNDRATLRLRIDKYLGGAGKAGVGCASAATYAAPSSAGLMAARATRALRASDSPRLFERSERSERSEFLGGP